MRDHRYAHLPADWPATGARVAEHRGGRVTIVTVTGRVPGGHIQLTGSPHRYRADTLRQLAGDRELLPLTAPQVRQARAVAALAQLAHQASDYRNAHSATLSPGSGTAPAEDAVRAFAALAARALADLDDTAEFPTDQAITELRDEIVTTLRRIAAELTAADRPGIVANAGDGASHAVFFARLADGVATGLNPQDALTAARARARKTPDALANLITDALDHLQECERCSTIGEVDAGSGLCDDCVSYNADRVVI